MNLKQIEKLYDTNEQENINLASATLSNQISTNNVLVIAAMLKAKYTTHLNSSDNLNADISNKLKEIYQWNVQFKQTSVADIFQLALQNRIDIKQLHQVKEYYYLYIESLINQIELQQTIKKNYDEGSPSYF
jgi:hypothetical protein